MASPPTTMSAQELWLALQEMPRPHKVVDFPRKKPDGTPWGQIAMWPLSQEEQMVASSAAEKFTRTQIKDGRSGELGYEAVYTNAACVEILFRACRDPQDIARGFFPTPSLLREKLSADECSILFEMYQTVQIELGPIIVQMNEKETDEWIARIVEGGSAFPFDMLSLDLQKALIVTLAVRASRSTTDTSSSGSPPESPPPSDPAATDDTATIEAPAT